MAKYGSEQILPYNNEEHKTTQVRRMFDSIAGTYDQLNHTLSLGIDKIWRRKGIAFLRPFSRLNSRYRHRHGGSGHLHAPPPESRPHHRGRHLGGHDGSRTAESR